MPGYEADCSNGQRSINRCSTDHGHGNDNRQLNTARAQSDSPGVRVLNRNQEMSNHVYTKVVLTIAAVLLALIVWRDVPIDGHAAGQEMVAEAKVRNACSLLYLSAIPRKSLPESKFMP
jgi:hypothetical protein